MAVDAQTAIDAIEAAYAKGLRSVDYGEFREEFASGDDMRRRIAYFKGLLTTPVRITQTFAVFSRE